jgi:hypothetical protein
LGLPCADPAFWLISAITPAIAGEATDVPPTSCAVSSAVAEYVQETAAETQIR